MYAHALSTSHLPTSHFVYVSPVHLPPQVAWVDPSVLEGLCEHKRQQLLLALA